MLPEVNVERGAAKMCLCSLRSRHQCEAAIFPLFQMCTQGMTPVLALKYCTGEKQSICCKDVAEIYKIRLIN